MLQEKLASTVMAYIGMAYIGMPYIGMASVVMAYMVMAYIVMAYIAMAYVVTTGCENSTQTATTTNCSKVLFLSGVVRVWASGWFHIVRLAPAYRILLPTLMGQ